MTKHKEASVITPAPDVALQAASARSAEELHNAIVELLVARRADIYTTLFVLEIIRHGLVAQKYAKLMG